MMKLCAMAVHGYVLQTKQSKNRQTLPLIGLNMFLRGTRAIKEIQVQPEQKEIKAKQDRPDRKAYPVHHNSFM